MNSLPTLSYTLLNDLQLRRRLRELGIPCDGNKQIMSRRHTEWRNLVNANCDSSNCKSKTELLKELNQWERIQNYTNHPQIGKTTKNLVMEKDFDRDNWSSSHGVDFQNLIAAAKSKAKQDMQKKSGTLDGDDVDRPAKSIDRDATNGKPLESTTTAIISSSQVQDISSLISSEETPKVGDFGVS